MRNRQLPVFLEIKSCPRTWNNIFISLRTQKLEFQEFVLKIQELCDVEKAEDEPEIIETLSQSEEEDNEVEVKIEHLE